jgi:hypothetical protein
MGFAINIRPFDSNDAGHVRDLFVTVNRQLAPPQMKQARLKTILPPHSRKRLDKLAPTTAQSRAGFGLPSMVGQL